MLKNIIILLNIIISQKRICIIKLNCNTSEEINKKIIKNKFYNIIRESLSFFYDWRIVVWRN